MSGGNAIFNVNVTKSQNVKKNPKNLDRVWILQKKSKLSFLKN